MSRKDIARDEREWERAFALRRDLAPFLDGGFKTRGSLLEFCNAHGCSRATAYRYLQKAKSDDSARVLRRAKPGRKFMSIGLSDEHETIIDRVLRKEFLTRNKISVQSALKIANVELAGHGLTKISEDVLNNRIKVMQDRLVERKRNGGKAARQKFEIIRGRNYVRDPLAIVQIDHTLLNIMVVDPETRECIGRPYLTVLLDLATGMPTGIFLTMNAPSALNLMMAFQRSVFPKSEYLASLGIQHAWPAHGLPLTISSDNGTDLKSKAFNRGLELYGVEHYFRPIAQPHWGGHIERCIGTYQRFVQTLPGTTFSSVEAKGTYKPEKSATLTLLEVEKLLLNYILDVQIHREKSRLQTSPINAWNLSWESRKSYPRLPQDPDRFRLDFLPFETRRIQREGVEFSGMFYRSAQLQKMKDCGVAHVTLKFDPTDIRIVHVSADDQIYFDLRSEHFPSNPLSLDDWLELRRNRGKRLNQNLNAPDPAMAHEYHQGVVREAQRLKRATTCSKPAAMPQGRDVRHLLRSQRFSERGGNYE
ncbi:MAG: transposase [Spongiibacteraceae bacterium]